MQALQAFESSFETPNRAVLCRLGSVLLVQCSITHTVRILRLTHTAASRLSKQCQEAGQRQSFKYCPAYFCLTLFLSKQEGRDAYRWPHALSTDFFPVRTVLCNVTHWEHQPTVTQKQAPVERTTKNKSSRNLFLPENLPLPPPPLSLFCEACDSC